MSRRGKVLWIWRTRRSRWSFARSKARGVTAWVKGELRGLKGDRYCEPMMSHGLLGREVGQEVNGAGGTRNLLLRSQGLFSLSYGGGWPNYNLRLQLTAHSLQLVPRVLCLESCVLRLEAFVFHSFSPFPSPVSRFPLF